MNAAARLKVGVLFGGRSAEHEVSILSARNVIAALDPERFHAVAIGITRGGRWIQQSTQRLLREKGDPRFVQLCVDGPEVSLLANGASEAANAGPRGAGLDVIFPVLHGPHGEDGTVQGLLELAGVPYVGAGVLGSAVGMDKDVMKRLLRDAGIPVARFAVARHSEYRRDPAAVLTRADALGYPLFVKPANLGSSVGVTRVLSRAQLPSALQTAFAYDLKVILEESITGREIECSVLGNDAPVASVPGEIVVTHPDGFYSYDAKYLDDHGSRLEIPASLDDRTASEVQRLSLETFRALECSGLARVDFFLRGDGQLFVNEINTLPGFTAISMYPKLWAASGVSPRELISRLIDLAIERHSQRAVLRSVCSVR
ncbi:D-alanine-D-alanine ligase [Povalibacter uvarum]|uniref:D-alanine--D-alanine ligase n=1 Tax=Povalibacter uvarum TaxID=732238 RepID=A0A841HH29_9GAMM|nr:D-alanine--D-alanine ligase family protein [Povalibacter uvarum]MBB6091395.1 D-alanine-D-alanine ligase [Povalibacter uvarum]